MLNEIIAVASLLIAANKAIVDYLADPVRKKFPKLDLWFLPYIAFITGGLIAWVAQINLFDFIPGLVGPAGQILTAAVIGGGSKVLHDLTDNKPPVVNSGPLHIPSVWGKEDEVYNDPNYTPPKVLNKSADGLRMTMHDGKSYRVVDGVWIEVE